jgi:cell division protein FtsB
MIAWLVCVSVALPAAVFYWYQRQLRMQDSRQHAENDALRERVAHLERQCAAAIQHLTEARDDMLALSNTVRDRDASLAETRRQRDDALAEIAQLAAQLDASNRRNETLEQRVTQLAASAESRAAAERDETMKLLAFSDQLHNDAAASAESMRRERDAAVAERDMLAHTLAATDALRSICCSSPRNAIRCAISSTTPAVLVARLPVPPSRRDLRPRS